MRRITRLAAIVAFVGAAAAPVAAQGSTAPPNSCSSWAVALSRQIAFFGILGGQADSYIAQRADNPCHARITPRSAFHAGDPS